MPKAVKHVVIEFDVTLNDESMDDTDVLNRIDGFLGECVWSIFPECFDYPENRKVQCSDR